MDGITISQKNQESFLSNLKQQTAESHTRLEENYYSKNILAPSVTNIAYQTYIAKLYGIILSCENDIFPALTWIIPDLDKRYKTKLIADDLENTGIPLQIIANLPVYKFSSSSIAEALGIMYVLEGSTLGGKFLYQHINKNLGFTAENGASYFWCYGQQTGVLWKTFISLLSHYAIDEDCGEIIISSARETFSNIDNWLTESQISWLNAETNWQNEY